MRLRKNAARAAVFLLTGALAAVMIFAVGNKVGDETMAASGTWGDYVSMAWVNPDDARYKNYEVEPGSSEDAPYLIQTAEEFSGIRAFEKSEALAGKYLMLVNDIDLSAHYWDPIELYGKGDPEDDNMNVDYGGIFTMPIESEIVHFDGNAKRISGMNIQNAYDEARIQVNFPNEGMGITSLRAGATGLFSFLYKARVADIRLDNAVINLTETSGIATEENYGFYFGEISVIDAMGTVVGVSQNSRVADVHVDGLELNYVARFGELLNGKCVILDDDDENDDMPSEDSEYGCDTYFSPQHILAGGAVGYSFAQTVVRDVSVKNGAVNVKPSVLEDRGRWMSNMDHGSVAVGGLVGYNFQSAVLNACSSADVVFSDDGYRLREDSGDYVGADASILPDGDTYEYGRVLNNYSMYFGGLVGFSSMERAVQTCIYNSCSHSELNIDAEISNLTAIGGLVGGLLEDSMVNNYFDGEIKSGGNVVGEIVGVLKVSGGSGHTLAANYYLDSGKPYGRSDDDVYDSAFAMISTVEKLVDDLNAGRALVAGDILDHADLSDEFLDRYITEWGVRDGSSALDCVGYRTAGLVFPDRRVEVPNTGVGAL